MVTEAVQKLVRAEEGRKPNPASAEETERAREAQDPAAVCDLIDWSRRRGRSADWEPDDAA